LELLVLKDEPNIPLLAIRGQINQAFVHPEKLTELEELIGPEVWKNTVLIDLSDATFVDSCGIGWLIANHKRFSSSGGRMVLHSLSPVVNRILGMIKLNSVVDIRSSEKEALQLAEGAST